MCELGVSQPRRATLDVIRRAFESAGVEFIDENGGARGCCYESGTKRRVRQATESAGASNSSTRTAGGPGVRLRKRHQKKVRLVEHVGRTALNGADLQNEPILVGANLAAD